MCDKTLNCLAAQRFKKGKDSMTDKGLPDDLPDSEVLSISSIKQAIQKHAPWLRVVDPDADTLRMPDINWNIEQAKHNTATMYRLRETANTLTVDPTIPVIDRVKKLLGAHTYADIVPRLTALIEIAGLWEETSRNLYKKLNGER